jgi:hypothetical protein
MQREAGLYEPPEWLSDDEVYTRELKEKVTLISAPALHKVIEILPAKNGEREPANWLIRLRPYQQRIKVVCKAMLGPRTVGNSFAELADGRMIREGCCHALKIPRAGPAVSTRMT